MANTFECLVYLSLCIIVVFAFTVHLSVLLQQLLSRETRISFTVKDEVPPQQPGITVCPPRPFSSKRLVEMGLNISDCQTVDDCMRVINELEGVVDHVSSEDLWREGALPLHQIISKITQQGSLLL